MSEQEPTEQDSPESQTEETDLESETKEARRARILAKVGENIVTGGLNTRSKPFGRRPPPPETPGTQE